MARRKVKSAEGVLSTVLGWYVFGMVILLLESGMSLVDFFAMMPFAILFLAVWGLCWGSARR